MTKDLRRLHNEELLDRLFTEEDCLSRAEAMEIVRRGQEILPMLAEIAMDRMAWTAELPEWWAPVHAAYLLGAMGGADALVPLMSALRWSDAYDNEWVTEDLPSILGSQGDISWPALVAAARDRTAGWSARAIAMDALASQALRFPRREDEAIGLLGAIIKDRSDEVGAHRSAAYILLDFRRSDFRRELMDFAKGEAERQRQFSDYRAAFRPEDVERDLATPGVALDFYIRDWMDFYDPAETRRRQERWAAEEGRARPDAEVRGPSIGKGPLIIGREAPCPCGSGRSYKRCCLRKLH